MLDGNPRLNLASFVTTWMEPECDKLIMDSLNKNYIDMDEYPITTELQVSYHANSFGALAPCSMSLSNKYSYRSTKQLSLILCINLELCAGLQCLQRDSVRSLLYIGDYPSDSSFCWKQLVMSLALLLENDSFPAMSLLNGSSGLRQRCSCTLLSLNCWRYYCWSRVRARCMHAMIFTNAKIVVITAGSMCQYDSALVQCPLEW